MSRNRWFACAALLCPFVILKSASAIVNGSIAEPYEAPYQIGLLLEFNLLSLELFCGGYIVAQNWIVTAAHCCMDCRNRKNETAPKCHVLIGGWDVVWDRFKADTKILEVNEIIIHPCFVKPVGEDTPNKHDICLIKTAKVMEYNMQVKPICFAEPTTVASTNDCLIAGWGLTDCKVPPVVIYRSERDYMYSDKGISNRITDYNITLERFLPYIKAKSTKLRELTAVKKSPEECVKTYKLRTGFACAVSPDLSGPYWGDSGGPLVCMGTDRKVYAFAHFIAGRCKPVDKSGHYLDNPKFYEWVSENIQPQLLNTDCKSEYIPFADQQHQPKLESYTFLVLFASVCGVILIFGILTPVFLRRRAFCREQPGQTRSRTVAFEMQNRLQDITTNLL